MKFIKIKYTIFYIKVVIYKVLHNKKFKLKGFRYFFDSRSKINIYGSDAKVIFNDKIYLSKGTEIICDKGKIKIGYNNFFNTNCKIIAMKSIEIGDNCLFGPNVLIFDHNHKYCDKNKLICKQGFSVEKIKIGNDVWIGANVVITSGATIGNRVIVGANSVVKGNLEDGGIYCGNPAKLVKSI